MAPSRGRGPQRKGQIRQALVPVVLLLALTYLGVRSYTSAEQVRCCAHGLSHAMPSWLSAARCHTLLVLDIQASTLIRFPCKS